MREPSQEPSTARIDIRLDEIRRTYDRVAPKDLVTRVAEGALVVDTRPAEQRHRDGEIPGCIVVERNVLEWRLDPTSTSRISEANADRPFIIVCNQGYSSTLVVESLHALGITNATDVIDGYQGLLRAGVIDVLTDMARTAPSQG